MKVAARIGEGLRREIGRAADDLTGPLGLKGWALGRLRLKRLKTCHGRF